MIKSKMCESCIHTEVCRHDKNLVGDVFVPGNPVLFDNSELYEKHKEWERAGFPCDDYMEIVRCVDCKYNYGIANKCEFNPHDIVCTYFETDGMDANDFCSYAERR